MATKTSKIKENGKATKINIDEMIRNSEIKIKEIEAAYHQEIGKLTAYKDIKNANISK